VDFAQSAGIDTSTFNFATNGSQAENLITLLGITHGAFPTARSWGALPGPGCEARVTAFVSLDGTAEAGLSFIQTNRTDYGVWLYREIPEPSAVYLVEMALVCFSGGNSQLLAA
jgi:hypothetical protein